MRYLFIDKVKRLEFNKQITAIKNVSLSEDVFREHFFGYPVMPGALLIETLAQAGTILLEVSAQYRKKALLVMVENAKFRSIVSPGDQLQVDMEVLSFDENSAKTNSTIHVHDKLVMTATIIFSLTEAGQFYPGEYMYMIKCVYDFILKDCALIGFEKDPE